MMKFFAPWFLCLVLRSVVFESVATDVQPESLLSKDKTISTTDPLEALVQCSENVVTLSNRVAELSRQCCQPGSSCGCHEVQSGVLPMDCHDLLLLGYSKSGIYSIHPSRCHGCLSVKVYCDMETAGGGWTVFLIRKEQEVQENFTRTWKEYSRGFGNPQNEHWLGNDLLHALTYNRHYVFRADMEDFEGVRRWAEYNNFAVGSRGDLYPLNITGYRGDAGDDMKHHNGQKFSTAENDNDSHKTNCAKIYKGGWWYGACHTANPTGAYLKGKHDTYADGVNWKSFRGYYYSLKNISLKIRPRDCSSFVHHSFGPPRK